MPIAQKNESHNLHAQAIVMLSSIIIITSCTVRDPDIKVYLELDHVRTCVPRDALLSKLIAKHSPTDYPNRRALVTQYDQYNLDWSPDLTLSELHYNCINYANLSNDNDWWVYVVGVVQAADHPTYCGFTWVSGSPNNPRDNSYSIVCVGVIENICRPHKTVEEGINTITAHEIFHQFHCTDHWGQPEECIMCLPLDTKDPQTMLCPACSEIFKNSEP